MNRRKVLGMVAAAPVAIWAVLKARGGERASVEAEPVLPWDMRLAMMVSNPEPQAEPVLFVGGRAHGEIVDWPWRGKTCSCWQDERYSCYTRRGPYAVADVQNFDARGRSQRKACGEAHGAAHKTNTAAYHRWCEYWNWAPGSALSRHYVEQRGDTA